MIGIKLPKNLCLIVVNDSCRIRKRPIGDRNGIHQMQADVVTDVFMAKLNESRNPKSFLIHVSITRQNQIPFQIGFRWRRYNCGDQFPTKVP